MAALRVDRKRGKHSRKPRRALLAALAALGVVLAGLPAVAGPTSPSGSAGSAAADQEGAALVGLLVKDRASLDRLAAGGVDLAEYVRPREGGLETYAVLTPHQRDELVAQGIRVTRVLHDQTDVARVRAEREATVSAIEAATSGVDTLLVLRAEWFVSDGETFISLEVKSSAGDDATNQLTATWGSTSVTMDRFSDLGQYLYHRLDYPVPVDDVPDSVTITSDLGASITTELTQWLGEPRKKPKKHYATDFVDRYLDPTESYQRIEALAAEFPELAEIVELPFPSNGYRRPAQALFGDTNAARFYVTSKAWGHDGGEDLTVELRDPGATSSPLSVAVNGTDIVVSLATDSAGEITSTAAEVVAAINASDASQLLTAATYRSFGGTGVVKAEGPRQLDDGLNAPESVSHEPFTMSALRIGKHRDGSRTGVLAYSQEHAREWVTPLVAIEAAERLLRNYQNDPGTKKIVDGLDIFIIPSVNPDGGHYSMYDFNFQRKNLTNYCGPEFSDPAARNAWGVDINRNFSVGSRLDGYFGASASCTSAVYSGPDELSEPEAKNEVWLTEQFANIKFAMNIHSFGGYFMWPPGAYTAPDRTPLERPTLGEESYFWAASGHILEAVQSWRGTAVWPGRTGPVIDVLYSAAGNSADEHWYERGIFGWDFEVGADRWNAQAQDWVPVGFQPPFSEGHQEAMEFASGLIGLFEVALAYGHDREPPRSSLVVTGTGSDRGISFTTSEPATVYYTVDGSKPDYSANRLESAGLREGPETVSVPAGTQVNWFSVDTAGNVENRYDPMLQRGGYRRATIP